MSKVRTWEGPELDYDYDTLARAIRRKKGRKSFKRLTLETGLSISTLSRLARNVTNATSLRPRVQGETVLRVCQWLGVPFEMFVRKRDKGQQPASLTTLDAIDYALSHDKALTREDARVLSDMVRMAYRAVKRRPEGGKSHA